MEREVEENATAVAAAKHAPTSEPLHRLFPQPEVLFPQVTVWISLTVPRSLFNAF